MVIFVATDLLYEFPFQMLATAKDNGSLQFLVERMAVVTAFKTSDIESFLRPKAAGKGKLVAFANPDGTLPGAAQEVRSIQTSFPQATVYLGKEAAKKRFLELSGKPLEYLHIATHGLLNELNPSATGLVLAGPGSQPERVTVSEIAGLDFHALGLVALSACDTARGQRKGAELATLADAFSYAGSPTVLASLWSVSDESTQLLMSEFYAQIRQGKSRAQALQLAQLSLLARPQFHHPFFWAPFILVGDWR